MAKRQAAEDLSAPSFEDSLLELQAIVSDLEDGALGLEASLARFERGIGLLRTCYSILESAEAKVEVLTRFNGDAGPETGPFDNVATASTGDKVPREGEPAGRDDSKSSLF